MIAINVLKQSPISYKHVNFCGVHRPCEQSYNKEDYCIHHANEKTRMWRRALDELGEKVCELYPFLCELCVNMGHFNFQCPFNRMSTVNLYCDDKITLNKHDELTLLGFLFSCPQVVSCTQFSPAR
jgi:hypothetical protein